MRKLGVYLMLSLFALALVSCKFEGKLSATGAEFKGEMGTTAEPAPSDANSKGRGTATMTDDGTVLEGEYFDVDGDGIIDHFKPDAGQGSGSASGETNGTDWYDVTLEG